MESTISQLSAIKLDNNTSTDTTKEEDTIILENKEDNNDNDEENDNNENNNNDNITNNNKTISFEISLVNRIDIGPSEILDGFLFLGSGRDANNEQFITENKISHVLCLIAAYRPKILYANLSVNFLHLPVRDSPVCKIDIHFNQAIEFIESAKKTNSKILVHCAAGISRSSSIVLAYLMKSHNMSLKEAFDLVKSRRSIFVK